MAYESGQLVLNGSNWLRTDWGSGKPEAKVHVAGKTIEGKDPLLDENFYPQPGSPIIDQASATPPIGRISRQWATANLQPSHEYDFSVGLRVRKQRGKALDLGAFEAR